MTPADQPDPATRASGPTTAQLKADIDSGKTGDKVRVSDPAMSPLGTDDEAGGRPNSPEAVALARQHETATPGRAKAVAQDAADHRYDYRLLVGAAVLVAVLLAVGIWIARGV